MNYSIDLKTITIVGEDYVPDIFTLIYERKNEK